MAELDDIPDMASAITSEFTAQSIKYIRDLEEALEAALMLGQAILMVAHGLSERDAKLRFMHEANGAPVRWIELAEQKRIYDNTLQVITEEIEKWQRESNDEPKP